MKRESYSCESGAIMSEELHSLRAALDAFVEATEVQSQGHIRPLHWHIAERLVLEGGFLPEDIVPRPPLRVDTSGAGRRRRHRLVYDPSAAEPGEQTVLGGLKTKQVDVVVLKKGIGPCVAVSVKGSLKAFRNLTNRMEEAAGDCTNIHIAYPTLVYGFLHVLRANREADVRDRNDVAILGSGDIAAGIPRYHDAMARLTGRRDVRDDVSRYESVCLALISTSGAERGTILKDYPPIDSVLAFPRFFPALYKIYDLRFVYAAPALESKTTRMEWAPDSPVLELARHAGFVPRVGEAP